MTMANISNAWKQPYESDTDDEDTVSNQSPYDTLHTILQLLFFKAEHNKPEEKSSETLKRKMSTDSVPEGDSPTEKKDKKSPVKKATLLSALPTVGIK